MSQWSMSLLIPAALSFFLSAVLPPGLSRTSPLHREVVVTASRIPSLYSDIARSVTVIDRAEIESAPVHSLQELLEYTPGVDVRQRGPLGVQADVSLRGGTFEQTLILINGIKVIDPQTGHNQIHLPLTLDDVDRVEILKGPGSRLYGPNAFGGVINIITRKSRPERGRINVSLGQCGLIEGEASFSASLGASTHSLSFSKSLSDGYRENTDFNISNFSYQASLPAPAGELSLLAGYADKRFGANGFYSDLFPNQGEHIKTSIVQAGGLFQVDTFSFSPKVFWRRNQDDFVLDRDRPEWYRNVHTTDSWGLEFQSSFISKLGKTAVGGEFGREEIASTRLGNRSRTKGGIFFEHQFLSWRKFVLIAGAFAYRYSEWGWRIWPGLELGFQLSPGLKFYGSWSHSFRVPTYTELYYLDPANKGNPGLKPEEAGEFEVGFHLRRKDLEGDIGLFRRDGQNLIDWVRTGGNEPWEARNILRLSTTGVEAAVRLWPLRFLTHCPVYRIQLGYSFLDSAKEENFFISKYLLDHLRHQFLLDLEEQLSSVIKQNLRVRYEQRRGQPGHILVDIRLSWRGKQFEFFLEAANLFNARYTEVGAIPMPGRWIRVGLKLDLRPVP
jgi:vitamin B12 transporter